jgi:hypothetical protein
LLVAGCLWAVAFIACSSEVTHSRWEQMSRDDRVLYVKTLIGEELSKDAKGGRGRKYSRPAEDYVKLIDEAYARGDARNVPAIFAELGSP